MAPTKAAPIVRFDREAGERRLEVAKWGLVPFFTKDLAKARKPINARSETVARSPLFKEAFARRRCLVPAAAYYEWRHDPSGKKPFAIVRNDGEPVALGGMWETWQSGGETLRTFATLTTEANPSLALIQDRMPVIIERADWPLWLGEEDGDATALLRPLPADRLRIWPVERTVNNVRNGKRSDPAWKPYTVLIRKETHKGVSRRLQDMDDGQDLSELVDELLTEWLRR
jgi:putative SOS response-associated peptidase YedK